MDPGGHMDGFLEACGDLSFSALVEKDEEIGSSSPPKAKKRKKDKKEKKGKKTSKVEKELAGDKDQELMADKASKLPAEEDPDETWPEHLPRPPPLDPYYLLGVPEEAPSHEDEEKPSKRAMQRALQGFSRKSGGWKHKKRGSGKSPLGKGRGKNCRYCANSFHQVTVVFLEFSAGFVMSCHHLRQGCFSRPGLGFLLPLVVEPCRTIHVVVLRVLAALEPMKRARAWSDRRSREAHHVAWAFTVQAPRLPWGILLLLVLLPQPRATAAAVMALMRLTTRRRRRLRRGGGLGAGAEAEIVVVVVLRRGALRRRCRPKGLRFHRRSSRRR